MILANTSKDRQNIILQVIEKQIINKYQSTPSIEKIHKTTLNMELVSVALRFRSWRENLKKLK